MNSEFTPKRYELSAKESIYSYINLILPYYAFELYDDVDEAALICAVKSAIEYHPLFGTRLVYDKGQYYYEENTMPPVVFRADRAPTVYGTAENNFYPWLVVYREKRITFYSMHFIADACGLLGFGKTVLHLYFEQKGITFKDTETDFPTAADETLEDAYERYADFGSEGVGTPSFAPAAEIDPGLLRLESMQPWQLTVPYAEIRKFSKESETSVFSVLSCILSRAMARAYGIKSGNINVRVPVNLRGAFPTETDRNFAQGFSLCYMSERMHSMPDAKIETAFRSQLDIWLEKGNLTQYLNDFVDLKRRLLSDPEAIKSMSCYGDTAAPRANILYTHITKMGFSEELCGLIADVQYAGIEAQRDFTNIYAINFRSDIRITLEQCSSGDCFIDALREVLKARGISHTLDRFELEPERRHIDTAALRNGTVC